MSKLRTDSHVCLHSHLPGSKSSGRSKVMTPESLAPKLQVKRKWGSVLLWEEATRSFCHHSQGEKTLPLAGNFKSITNVIINMKQRRQFRGSERMFGMIMIMIKIIIIIIIKALENKVEEITRKEKKKIKEMECK